MRFLKVGAVIFGALVITTLGISAADTFSGNNASLVGQLIQTEEEGACPVGMVEVVVGQTFSCVDIYEVSVSEECPVSKPSSLRDSQENINHLECNAVSVEGQNPWTYVTREQAQALCMRSGKRLPSALEWQLIAVGTPDTEDVCRIDSVGIGAAGSLPQCVSASGVYDAVGNVWEWTSDDVIDGQYNNRSVPQEGYISQVDAGGIATVTTDTGDELFGEDYFWSSESGAYGVLRGGFYGSQTDAGVYAAHMKTPPTAALAAVGFRCVR